MADYWTGVERVARQAAEVKRRKTQGARAGIELAMENTLGVSNSQVPHEEGDLERDGGWSLDNSALLAAWSYGRSADTKNYAVVQHEDMSLNHDSGRNAKFLENAINSTKAQNGEIIASSIRRELGT